MKGIYLDHAATTPIHPEVLDAMLPYYHESFGNASSMHAFGRQARNAINRSRDSIAKHIGSHPSQVIFTSGGTESNNTALFGVCYSLIGQNKHIITTEIEHHAVLEPSHALEKLGFDVTYLKVDSSGMVQVQDVEAAIRPNTVLISVMYGNNEVGTLQPIEEIGQLARSRGILFHVDAVQALGKVPIDLSVLSVDLMSFSAHKIGGPKGIGALYAAKNVHMSPYLHGGSQERNRRGGTENVAGIAGFARAVELAVSELASRRDHMEQMRSAMLESLTKYLGSEGWVINGHPTRRLPHILNVSFPGIDTETMLMNLDLEGIAASSGSACTSGSLEISHVLKAMHLPEKVMQSAVRFSFGMGNAMDEIETTAQKIATIIKRLRK